MSTYKEKVKAATVDYLEWAIKHGAGGRAPFRVLSTMLLDGHQVPVLIVGRVDCDVEDGDAYAIVNPDVEILDSLKAGVGQSATIREIVSGKCDQMLHVWLDAYKKGPGRAQILDSYRPRTPAGVSRFTVR